MPLNVRRFNSSIFLVLLSFVTFTHGQSVTPAATNAAFVPPSQPTSGDVMRDRISKSKAYIAVRNYNAAIFELENLRRETSDPSVQGVVNVLLMNSYLEQGDYKRAQDMLKDFYARQKTTQPNAEAAYLAVAGQIVKGARSRAERYNALGLSLSDRTLPLEALNDLEKMRETLELVITQAREISADKTRAANAMVILEEATGSRSTLGRDDYDARRWRDELADTREKMAMSGSIVTAVGGPAVVTIPVAATPAETLIAQTTPQEKPPVAAEPAVMTETTVIRDREVKQPESAPAEPQAANVPAPIYVRSAPPTVKESAKPAPDETEIKGPAEAKVTKDEATAESGPIEVGSLLNYATSRSNPVYPPAAKTIRTTGVVKVEIMVNEEGEVTEIQKASGPPMLQSAAKDAVRKWKFKPFLRDGQPVKATGYVSFNFSL